MKKKDTRHTREIGTHNHKDEDTIEGNKQNLPQRRGHINAKNKT